MTETGTGISANNYVNAHAANAEELTIMSSNTSRTVNDNLET